MPDAVVYRTGAPEDSYAVFRVFEESLTDLVRRMGEAGPMSWDDPAALAKMWEERRSLYEHLADTTRHFVIAEREGRIIGFARSICRDGVQELTELFVLPAAQGSGVGRELLVLAFPVAGPRRRCIVASPDVRANALYLKSGVYPRFPVCYFGHTLELADVKTDLAFMPLPQSPSPDHLSMLAEIDRAILDHRRDEDHRWLAHDRQGYLYLRGGKPTGYGYTGKRNGPFALLDQRDFPGVLAHAERAAAGKWDHFGFEAPMINTVVVDYALARGFRMDSFTAWFMSDAPFGKFENYILTSPPFFM
jgi:GNAT superfamily N-acetyltransferase